MKKIALACTGGGVKACVNIGVLRALRELNIEVEAVSGASLGGLVALLHTLNYSPEEMLEFFEKDVIQFEKFNALEILCSFPSLIINGGAKNPKDIIKFARKIEEKGNIKLMRDIKTPLIIPSLDISKRAIAYYSSKPLEGNVTYYQDREISEAIRSTTALPLLFTPHKVIIDGKNHFMLDGGILTNTLVSPLRQFSDYVIGVTNKFYPKQRSKVNLFTGFTQTFQAMRKSYLFNEKQKSDLWIQVDAKSDKFMGSLNDIKYCEEIGYITTMECAREHYLDEIKEVV